MTELGSEPGFPDPELRGPPPKIPDEAPRWLKHRLQDRDATIRHLSTELSMAIGQLRDVQTTARQEMVRLDRQLRDLKVLREDVTESFRQVAYDVKNLNAKLLALSVSSGAAGGTTTPTSPSAGGSTAAPPTSAGKGPSSASAESGPSIARSRAHSVRQGSDDEDHEERPWPG